MKGEQGRGRGDEMRQDGRRIRQETCQHCGRLVPSLINIFIFKVTLQSLGSVVAQTGDVFCVQRKIPGIQSMPFFSNTYPNDLFF